jgi:hypothetical protein
MGIKISKIPLLFLGGKKKREKNCKDIRIDQDLTKFAKISTPESLKILYLFLFL